MKSATIVCVGLLLCMWLFLYETEARGARGGFRGGGFRSSRSYRSYRSARSYRSYRSSRSYIRTRSSVFNWKTAAAAGAIYGWSRYSNRRYYHSHRDRRPQICVNYHDYKMTNGTAYTLFVCPAYGQSDVHTYCCGPEDRQKCCTFWDDGGRVAGVVFSILAFIAITASVAYCCWRSHKKSQRARQPAVVFKKEMPQYQATPNQIPAADMHRESKPYSGTGAPAQPGNVTANYPQDGANAGPFRPTQAYPTAPETTPYPLQPEGPAPYPPQPGDGPTPYPPHPGSAPNPYPSVPYPVQPGNPTAAPGGGPTPYPLNPAPGAPAYPPQPFAPGAGDPSYPAVAPPPYPSH